MAKKISQLGLAGNVTVDDLFQVVDKEDTSMASTGTNKRITAQTLGNFLPVTATGSTTSRSLKDRFADVVNVKNFGAVGDGVTDDTAAIQAAANAASGKVLHFPAGSYVVVNGFSISGDNTTIDGYSAVLIYPATTATYYHCIRITGNNVSIFGISIVSPSGLVRDDTGFGISAGSTATQYSGLNIQDCLLKNIGSAGIWVSNMQQIRVSNCTVNYCLADGIHFSDGCYDIVASGNTLRDNDDDNIAIVNDTVGTPYVGRFSIVENIIVGDPAKHGTGVALIGAGNGVVSNNSISNTAGPGIATYFWTDTVQTDSLLIEGNVITNTGNSGEYFGGCGILLGQSYNVTIRDNFITNTAYSASLPSGGILAQSSASLVISNNTFENSACDHLIITNANIAVISNNSFAYTARESIKISGVVSSAFIQGNTFVATQGVNDINVNLPSNPVFICNNIGVKKLNVISSNNSDGASYDNIILSNQKSTTAVAGALTLPANPQGFIIGFLGSAKIKIPYYG